MELIYINLIPPKFVRVGNKNKLNFICETFPAHFQRHFEKYTGDQKALFPIRAIVPFSGAPHAPIFSSRVH